MNLVPGRLEPVGSGLAVRLEGGVDLPVPEARARRYREAAGSEVLFGLRPEDFSPQPNGGPSIEVTPEVIEPLGSDTLLFFTLGPSEVVARVPPGTEIGEAGSLTLYPSLARMHLFERASGRVL
jgi:multiple sugar transport system ATP-binding protein